MTATEQGFNAGVEAAKRVYRALKLLRGLVQEGGVPRYTVTPGAALNSIIEEDVDPALLFAARNIATLALPETAPAGDVVKPPTATEILMNDMAVTKPARDELKGEQTFLTYNEHVGTWDLRFYEAGWSMHDRDFLGATHWLDITAMWPGVIAQVTSSNQANDIEPITTLIGNEARRYASHYKPSSDGRNTFLMFAEWVEKLAELPVARVL